MVLFRNENERKLKMEYKNILYEKKGHVGIVRLNRPQVLNALDDNLLHELAEIFHELDADDDIRAVILAGDTCAKAFSAGGDIAAESKKGAIEGYEFARLFTKVTDAIENFKAPVIAAIHGYCLGGGVEIAIACDVRIAADTAKLGSPEISLGLLPGAGGTQRLARMMGLSKARMWIYSCDKYTAKECLNLGVVDMVVPADRLMGEALILAEKYANQAPMAIRYAKILTYEGIQMDLTRALRMEAGMAAHLFETEDKKEACMAFLEKRKRKPFVGY